MVLFKSISLETVTVEKTKSDIADMVLSTLVKTMTSSHPIIIVFFSSIFGEYLLLWYLFCNRILKLNICLD
ncbi:hypothetical protein ASC72_21660 [Flavobacterium sp. Root420]|nr:hypothetical protein ASC72_21660 [Flavobacterium sp. Root420]